LKLQKERNIVSHPAFTVAVVLANPEAKSLLLKYTTLPSKLCCQATVATEGSEYLKSDDLSALIHSLESLELEGPLKLDIVSHLDIFPDVSDVITTLRSAYVPSTLLSHEFERLADIKIASILESEDCQNSAASFLPLPQSTNIELTTDSVVKHSAETRPKSPETGNHSISSHRFLLAVRIPYYEALFTSQFTDSKSQIVSLPFDLKLIKLAIQFARTNSVSQQRKGQNAEDIQSELEIETWNEVGDEKPVWVPTTLEDWKELWRLAEYLQFQPLIDVILEKLYEAVHGFCCACSECLGVGGTVFKAVRVGYELGLEGFVEDGIWVLVSFH
jgi:hypothetical protein